MSNNMKVIMERWDRFCIDQGQRQKLLENHEYITYVLGIQIPLQESVVFSESFKNKILQEQLLLEAFFDDALQKVIQSVKNLGDKAEQAIADVKTWTKNFGDRAGKLIHALWILFKDPSQIKKYIDVLNKRMNIRRIGEMDDFLDNLEEILKNTSFFQVAEKIKNFWITTKEKYESMQTSWKKALVGSTLMVVLQYVFDKIKKIKDLVSNYKKEGVETLTDSVKEMVGEQAQELLLSFFEKTFGSIFKKVAEYSSGVMVWIDWISKIVGGVDYVAAQLFGTTEQFTS